MIKDRISEEQKIASPCQNNGDLICSILKYEVCTRSYISLFFDYIYRNVAIKLYVFLIIWNSSIRFMSMEEMDWILNFWYFYLIIAVWISCWFLRRSGECSPRSLPVMQLGSCELLVFFTCWMSKEKSFSESVSRNGPASRAHRTVQLLSHTGQLWAAAQT